MLDMLAELCIAWPKRWDEYVSPACWIKRTLFDPTLPKNMTLFEIFFGRKAPHIPRHRCATDGHDGQIGRTRQLRGEQTTKFQGSTTGPGKAQSK